MAKQEDKRDIRNGKTRGQGKEYYNTNIYKTSNKRYQQKGKTRGQGKEYKALLQKNYTIKHKQQKIIKDQDYTNELT